MATHLLDWDDTRQQVCAAIHERQTTLKIVLKTKNERHFLKRWIDHHAAIVGIENLIIFDNHSDDQEVVQVLEEAARHATVARFAGWHNRIHKVAEFPELFEALASSRYFLLLDTDEFFIWIRDDMTLLPPSGIVPELEAMPQHELIIGVWAANYPFFDNRFILYTGKSSFPIGLTAGKSLIAGGLPLTGTVCHNFQLEGVGIGSATRANALICHMKNLDPDQRVRTNLAKLRQYRFLTDEEGLDKVLQADPAQMKPGNVRQWVREVQAFSADLAPTESASLLRPGCIEVKEAGLLEFYSIKERVQFSDFLDRPAHYVEMAWRDRSDRQSLPSSKKSAR